MGHYRAAFFAFGSYFMVHCCCLRLQDGTTDQQLQNLVDTLWKKDDNRLMAKWDYNYDPQAKVYYTERIGLDYSTRPFLSGISSQVLTKPTFKAFVALLDNYDPVIGRTEKETNAEKEENWRFINAVFSTRVMQEVYAYLKKEGIVVSSPSKFRSELYNIWFGMYRRRSFSDSSGFEHVFVGELREKVLGLHNWVQFYLQERKGALNYIGHLGDRRDYPLFEVQFIWQGKLKPVGSIFIGTSPEFEFALYTLVFKLGRPVRLRVGGQLVEVKCFQTAGKVGSCYASSV